MNTPHKHADILRAIADGKEVQWYSEANGEWFDPTHYTPITEPEYEWRIKPEPKPDIVLWSMAKIYDAHNYAFIRNADTCMSPQDNLRLTFDGETGKLKAAEVIE